MRPRALIAALAAVLLAAAGCSSSAAPAPSRTLDASLSEFKITANTAKLAAGQVTFAISNKGSIAHEFVIVRTELSSDALPKAPDGGVDEEASDVAHVDEAEGIDPGATRTLTETLAPGKYVFFCNLPGHFAGGMRGSFEVVSTS